MLRTTTLMVDLRKLKAQGSEGILVVQLMRAADDIALANWGLRFFKEPQPNIRRHLQAGACRYFIRLQCGHLSEALPLTAQLQRFPGLVSILDGSPAHVRRAHQRLTQYLPSGPRRDRFEQWIRSIRNRLAFHYDRSLVERALTRRAGRPDSQLSSITRGTDISLWRFNVADDLEDTIICRELWKIPYGANVRREADRRADFGSRMCSDFLDFAGEVTFRFAQMKAAC